MNKITPIVLLLVTALGVQGCKTTQQQRSSSLGSAQENQGKLATTPVETPATTKSTDNSTKTNTNAQTKAAPKPSKPTQYRQFPTDTLYSLLVAEIAASRQQFDLTLDHYIHQANNTNDKQIIARAARIAQYFRAKQESLDMGLMWLKHEPENIEALTLVANAWLELDNPIKALEYTERLFPLTSLEGGQDIGTLIETIANFSKQANSDQVQQLIQRLTELQPQHPTLAGIQVGLSVLYQVQGNLEQADYWVQQALAQEPNRATAIIQDAVLLQQSNNSQQAADKLKAQLDKHPSNSRLRLVYARLLTQLDIEEAYRQFTLLSEQSPNQLDLKFSRALIATELKNTPIAQKLLEELLALEYRADTTRFYLAHNYELQKHLDEALAHYLKISDGENYLPAQSRAGRILIKQNQLAQANIIFNQLRNKYPEKQQQLYINESDVLIQSKHYDQALVLLTKAIERFPDNTGLRYNRSTIYEKQNRLVLMESDLRHVLTIDPDNVSALNGLGYFLATRTDRYDEALALIEKALAIRPQDAAIIDSMGWVSFKLGRLDEALAYLRKAFAIFPDPEVAAHLGEVLWVRGQQQEAKDIWQGSLQQHPDSQFVKDTMKRLGVSP